MRRPLAAGMVTAATTAGTLVGAAPPAAKQGKGNLDAEGSGADARAWWQRTKDDKLDCDGRAHTVLVKLQRTPGKGRLIPEPRGRRAWVQFCLLTGNTPEDFQEAPSDNFDSIMKWKRVVRRG